MDLKDGLCAAFRGFCDSFRGLKTLVYMDRELNERTRSRLAQGNQNIRRRSSSERENHSPIRALKAHEESKVLTRTMHCCLLNFCIFLCSIICFEYILLPTINTLLEYIFGNKSLVGNLIWSWIKPCLSWLFKTLWVLPLFVLSKLINSLWFQDIADTAFRYRRGRPQFTHSISKSISDTIFSILVQILFLVQGMIVEYIPIYGVGYVLSLVHMCLLYSLYSFEYKWFNMGWELHHRLDFIEMNWPYFIGFGLPLTLITQFSYIISACIFSTTFPIFIISANEANPVTIQSVYPLHLFSPSVKVSNILLRKTIGGKKPPPNVAATPKR
ncbi:etoposide-induced protein 2.4 homolog [Onthophagus taurus]|uniref:etoposide-induced protein 2.4 homolog n=1 Tax=Onthophagus taurus TaxID=166361 RepID=UPI000C2091DD|nr:etoposide-induced protein 2.4 homolog [Onthophagus taurus]